jgi:lipid-binding SYLF domain-containing protein
MKREATVLTARYAYGPDQQFKQRNWNEELDFQRHPDAGGGTAGSDGLCGGPVQAADKAQQQADIRKVSQDILSELIRVQPSAQGVVDGAAGFAVFSTAGLKIFVAGGGMGSGMAVNNQTKQVVFMKMAEVQAGVGLGYSKLKQVWIFDTQTAFNNFVNSGWEFGGQATLNAQAAGQGGGYAGAIPVSPGVWIYQLTGDGLAASVTVKGSKYYKADDLN